MNINDKPDNYFGKEVVTYGFEVTNHPLDKKDKTIENHVALSIMLVDGKVVCGFSISSGQTVGSYYSVDGKTMEEVTGLDYKQWYEDWKKRYGN